MEVIAYMGNGLVPFTYLVTTPKEGIMHNVRMYVHANMVNGNLRAQIMCMSMEYREKVGCQVLKWSLMSDE
jgi:hypothetical protein